MRFGCAKVSPRGGGKGPLIQVDISGTIGTVNDQTIFDKDERIYDMTHAEKAIVQHNICPPLIARMGTGGNQVPFRLEKESGVAVGVDTATVDKAQKVMESYRVRRLLPVECERLQGFPDDWTKIPYRGKSAEYCPDSPRYKAIGNSWAVPCVRWIGRRIDAELKGAQVEKTEVKKAYDEKPEEVIAIQGSVIGRDEKNGPQGQGFEQESRRFTDFVRRDF